MKNTELFNKQGCLSAEGIERYISNELSHEDLLLVNQHLKSCGLCKTAVEGARQLKDVSSFKNHVRQLESRWAEKRMKRNFSYKKLPVIYGTVAAAIIVLVGLTFLVRNFSSLSHKTVAYNAPKAVNLDSISYIDTDIIMPVKISKEQRPLQHDKKARDRYIKAHKNFSKEEKISATVKNARIVVRKEDSEKYDSSNSELDFENGGPSHSSLMSTPPLLNNDNWNANEEKNNNVLTICEVMPRFNDGGLKEFIRYVHRQIRYPRAALEAEIQGRVYVQFTIDETGKLVNPRILKGCNPLLEKEVLRVLRNSPRWEPGTQNGLSVNISITMPVDFYIHK